MSPSCGSTMHNATQRCITYRSSYLSTDARPSCNPHPALTRSTRPSWTRCDEFLGWGGGVCSMNGSHCVTLGRSGSPPPVFNYSSGQATSDKLCNVASRRVFLNSDAVHTLTPPPPHYRIIQVRRREGEHKAFIEGCTKDSRSEISGERMCLVCLDGRLEPLDLTQVRLQLQTWGLKTCLSNTDKRLDLTWLWLGFHG